MQLGFGGMGDILHRPVVLGLGAIAAYVLYQLLRPSKLPKVPIVGAKPGEWFALQRAKWRKTKDMKTATETAYNQYRDRACIFFIRSCGGFSNSQMKISAYARRLWILCR